MASSSVGRNTVFPALLLSLMKSRRLRLSIPLKSPTTASLTLYVVEYLPRKAASQIEELGNEVPDAKNYVPDSVRHAVAYYVEGIVEFPYQHPFGSKGYIYTSVFYVIHIYVCLRGKFIKTFNGPVR